LVSEGMEIDRLKMLIEENAQAGFEYFIYWNYIKILSIANPWR
jgi:hypothetical protein